MDFEGKIFQTKVTITKAFPHHDSATSKQDLYQATSCYDCSTSKYQAVLYVLNINPFSGSA